MTFYFLNTDVSMFTAIFLLIIFVYTYKQLNTNRAFTLILKALTYSCIITLVSESLNNIMKHEIIYFYNDLNTLLHTITFIGGIAITYFFGLFVGKYITPDKFKLSIPFMLTYSIPLIVYVAALVFVNPQQGIFFSLAENGDYLRGDYFVCCFLPTAIYIVFTFTYLLLNRKYISLKKLLLLLSVSSIPVIGCILQIMLYGILVMYPFVGISLILVYIFLQNELVLFDNITKAEKLSILEDKLHECEKNKEYEFSLAYFDINDLHSINENFGNVKGNVVLKNFVDCVINNLEEDSFVSRIGGDEFIAFINTKDQNKIKNILKNTEKEFNNMNILGKQDSFVTYSVVYDSFDETKYLNAHQLIANLENKLFLLKESKLKGVLA